MAVQGSYIGWRVRQSVLPFVRIYGQWVEERIIPLASQLQMLADDVQQETYDQLMSLPAGEDYSGDGSDEAEYAFDVSLSFYENITAMYQATLNLFAAGLFHVIEQQLADLTRDGAIEGEVSDTKLQVVNDWYKQHFQLDLTQFPSWSVIEELRLVANTTKHAEGSAAVKLRGIHPELFQNPLVRQLEPNTPIFQLPVDLPLGGNGLYVTGDDFRTYQKSALELFGWLIEHFEKNGDQYYPR